MKKSQLYIYAIFSGILLALSFPPLPFNALAFIGLVPLLYLLDFKPRHTFFLIYITFFIYHTGTNWWISSWQADTDPYLMVSGLATALIHPFFFFIPFIPYVYVKKRLGTQRALWYFPFFWVTFEWLHSLGDLAYPWLSLGYTQLQSIYWVQFADLGGNYFIGFVIVLINVLLLKSIYSIKTLDEKNRKITLLFLHRRFLKYAIPILLIFIIPYIYGFIRIDNFEHEELLKKYETVNVGVIQANINPWQKWETSAFEQIAKHIDISDSLIDATKQLDAVIWSETAILYLNYATNFGHDFSILHRWIDKNNISLISGFADMKLYGPGETPSIAAKTFRGDSSMIYDSYNSLLLLNPQGSDSSYQIYRKMRLTPFGERIPYMELFSFARKWLEWGVGISSWAKGKEQKVLIIKTTTGKKASFAPVICIESIYPSFVRRFIEKGGQFIAIITNDAWYDHTVGPEQHYQIARMRAIETRRYVARCANTGISGFIEASGKTLLRAPQYKAIGIAATIPLLNEKTIYVKYGDWIVYISLLFTFLSIISSLLKHNAK